MIGLRKEFGRNPRKTMHFHGKLTKNELEKELARRMHLKNNVRRIEHGEKTMGFQLAESLDLSLLSEEMMELTLLLPQSQVQSLERLAQSRGMRMGPFLRGLIRDTLSHSPETPPATPKRFD